MERKVKYCVAVSSEILGDSAPVPFQGDLAESFKTVAGLGFDSIEYHLRNPESVDRKKLKALAKKHGLSISAFGTGLEYGLNKNSFTSSDPEVRKRTGEKFRTFIDLAAEFGACVFLGLCRGTAPSFREREKYLDLFVREALPLVDYAKKSGVVLALEPIVFYMTNLLNKTVETIDFISLRGLDGVQLLLDTHHMFIEDPDTAEAFRASAGLIAHIHMSDSDRRFPGSGNVDYDGVGKVLKEIGYSGPVSLEILPYPDGVQASRYGLNRLRKIWG
jgi:sugar phosphate isomerase/epimerase